MVTISQGRGAEDQGVAPAAGQGSGRRRTGAGSGRINGVFAVILVVLVVLAPLPLGSHRPVFWALGALVLGLLGTVYFALLFWREEVLRVPLGRLGVPLALAGLYLGYVIVQGLPWPGGLDVALPQGMVHSGALSLSAGDTWLAGLRLAGYGILFVLMVQVAANRGRARDLAWLLFAAIGLWAVYGLVALIQFGDSLLVFDKWAYQGVVTGPFVNRNSFAFFLAMGLVCGTGLVSGALAERGARWRDPFSAQNLQLWLGLLGLVVVLVALLRTESRMGLVAGLAGAVLSLLLVLGRRRGFGLRTILGLAAGGFVGLGVLLALYGRTLLGRLGSVDTSLDVRAALYEQVVGMIAARPWTGWGADSFGTVFRAFRTTPVSTDLSWARTHSTYLAHWVETGVLFGSIPLILVAIGFVACLRAALQRSEDIVLPAIGAGVILAGALHSLIDFSLEIQANVWMFLALIALALARVPRPRR